MTDLFSYPRAPGFKERHPDSTSRAAAEIMRGSAETLRTRVLHALRCRAMTADECAAALGEDILSIRPRLSELSRLDKIERTIMKRPNASGCNAWVWKAKQ